MSAASRESGRTSPSCFPISATVETRTHASRWQCKSIFGNSRRSIHIIKFIFTRCHDHSAEGHLAKVPSNVSPGIGVRCRWLPVPALVRNVSGLSPWIRGGGAYLLERHGASGSCRDRRREYRLVQVRLVVRPPSRPRLHDSRRLLARAAPVREDCRVRRSGASPYLRHGQPDSAAPRSQPATRMVRGRHEALAPRAAMLRRFAAGPTWFDPALQER